MEEDSVLTCPYSDLCSPTTRYALRALESLEHKLEKERGDFLSSLLRVMIYGKHGDDFIFLFFFSFSEGKLVQIAGDQEGDGRIGEERTAAINEPVKFRASIYTNNDGNNNNSNNSNSPAFFITPREQSGRLSRRGLATLQPKA